MDIHSIIENFKSDMLCKGINPPSRININGKIQRFRIQGDNPGARNGWCILHTNNDIACGVYGSWKFGVTYKWTSKPLSEMTQQERENYQVETKKLIEVKQIDLEKKHKAVAISAKKKWDSYSKANPNHPYLVKKKIQPYCARQYKNKLVLALMNITGSITTLQYISGDGSKFFLSGGKVKGSFIVVKGNLKLADSIGIAEGYATAATIAYFCPHKCMIAACNSNNLIDVAKNIRNRKPEITIHIYADDDRLTDGNPGLTAASKAAEVANAYLIIPPWPDDAPEYLTDFNDFYNWKSANGGF